MRVFQTSELARMRAAQEASMMDACEILPFEEGEKDKYGKPAEEYGDPVASVCGYHPTARREVMDGAQVALTDAELRLPSGTTISHLDRVRITHRIGVEMDPQPVYEVIGEPGPGPSGLLVGLRLVMDGSDG